MSEGSQAAGLRRVLGPWSAGALVVGTIIGSGIFLVPNAMARQVGSAQEVFAVWVVGGLLALFGALSYAELAGAMPEAGGDYVYLREAYGPLWGFLYGWSLTWVLKSGSIATLATAFFYYLANFHPELERTFYAVPLPIGAGGGPLEIRYGQFMAVVVIVILAVVNYIGVKLGGGVQVAVTILKVAMLGGIVAIGLGSGAGTVENFGSTTVAAAGGVAGFFAALVAALWAYDGWTNLPMVASEIKRPERNLPLALVAGSIAVMLIYLITNAAYFYVLPVEAVAAGERVAADMMGRILGPAGAGAVSVAAMVSIFAALNGAILSAARVPYAMAVDRRFFRALGHVHPVHRTPSVSILVLTVWSSVLVFSGRYEQLFTYVIFASWIFYGMCAAAVIVLRIKRPDLPRPYRTVGYPLVPVLFILGAAGVVVATLFSSPRESLMGLGLILAGLPFYYYWERRRGLPQSHMAGRSAKSEN